MRKNWVGRNPLQVTLLNLLLKARLTAQIRLLSLLSTGSSLFCDNVD